MSQQKRPVGFKDQVAGSVLNPNERNDEEQQQQAIATNPPPTLDAPRATDTGSTHSSRPKLHKANEGETLLPHFKDQIRENHPPLPNLDPPPNDALEETPSLQVDVLQAPSLTDDPRTVVAVAIPDSQLQGEEQEVYMLQRLPANQPQEENGRGMMKRQTLFILTTIVVAVAAISLGVTCGLR